MAPKPEEQEAKEETKVPLAQKSEAKTEGSKDLMWGGVASEGLNHSETHWPPGRHDHLYIYIHILPSLEC